VFFASYMVIFLLAGIGNGSTYRMIPSIFAALGRKEADEKGLDAAAARLEFKRHAAAVLGIAGSIGAFGGFLIQVVFRQASLPVAALMTKATKTTPVADKALLVAKKHAIAIAHQDWSVSALWVFLAAYVVFAGMTWFFYMRRSLAVDRVPSLAYAAV
jgi:NNP family nitrate/nitrite transporter-like MFS transporter